MILRVERISMKGRDKDKVSQTPTIESYILSSSPSSNFTTTRARQKWIKSFPPSTINSCLMEIENEPGFSSPIPQSQNLKVNFFDLSIEIRLKIYEELLVVPEPLSLILSSSPGDPTKSITIRKNSDCLSPRLLRVNQQIHHEATPLLYRNNRFHLSRLHRDFGVHMMPSNHGIVKFLTRVGDYNASMIRHLDIYFPICTTDVDLIKKDALEFIRDKCTNLTTVKMLVWNRHDLNRTYGRVGLDEPADNIPLVQDLKMIDAELKKISSLREISVDFCSLSRWSRAEFEDWMRKLMHYCGWEVQLTMEETPESPDSDD
ncbi:hypothetical protein BOTCAL_0408g00140 [Botryotinia calthae]|uniref:F-box domain-containing protein n=1 Tax=Botryotinia calthae TaxID=38488 RepID=A0A4Y8CPV1_9HELO|nr:hypothetical protein BOTCAL_0408g00140 [Botryotinia calthae]